MKNILLLLFCMSGAAIGFGQEGPLPPAGSVKKLSLAEAVEIARTQNFDIRAASSEHDAAAADFRKSSSVFLPQLSVSETFVSTNDPLNVFGLKLKQESVTAADFNPPDLNHPPAFQNFTTKFEAAQPIFNLDGFFGRHAAGKAADAAEMKLHRTQYGIELQAKSAYFGFILARQSLDVITQSLAAGTSYREQARNIYEKGLIQRSDLLMAEVRVSELETKKVETENTIADAESALRQVLGFPDSIRIEPADTLTMVHFNNPGVNIDAVNRERSDMLAMQDGIDAFSGMKHMQMAKFFPSLNAFASYELNNPTLSGTSGRNWMVGAMLKWNILSGFDQLGEMQKAEAQRSSLETQYEKMKMINANEISSAVRSIDHTSKLVSLADATAEQAAEQLRIMADRYSSGLERTSDLLQAEASYSNARLGRLNALYRHAVSVFMLEFLLERKVTQ
jgi:outer membrane protein TolC